MQLKTKRLQIRPFLESDLCDVYEYCAQDGVGIHASWAAHASLNESAEILHDWISAGRKHAIVLLETGKVIGHLSIAPDSEEGRADTRELGCALNLQYHRKGIMTEAVKAVLTELFHTEDIQFVWACCFQTNGASKGFIEKCGFRFMQEGAFFSSSLNKEFSSYEYRMTKEEGRADTRELGCALNLQYHRKGIMTEAVKVVLAELFHTEDIQFAWACCFQTNGASKGFIEKCGFRFMQEGAFFSSSLNKAFSSYEYRITKQEWQAIEDNDCP